MDGKRNNKMTINMNSLTVIENKIVGFESILADDTLSDKPQQICLSCRGTYGLVVQSLAWADDNEVNGIFYLVRRFLALAEEGIAFLKSSNHPQAPDYIDSVQAKVNSLTSVIESGNKENLFEAIA